MSEFVLALSIIFVGIVPPIVDLMGLAVGYGVTQLIARRAAARAANATDFNNALNEMQTEALSLNNTALAQYCKLAPTGGYGGCGVDLYIKETNIYTNKTNIYGPNQTLKAADPSTNIYECTTQANYQVSPLIPMTLIPFFSNIEGVGQPFTFGTAWNVALEHPQLLDLSSTAFGFTTPYSLITPLNPGIAIRYPPLADLHFATTGVYEAGPGQTDIDKSPKTFALTDLKFNTGLAPKAGDRISLQMVSVGGPKQVTGTLGGVTFKTATDTLDFVVPKSGELVFEPKSSEGWSATTPYNLKVIITN